MNKNTILNTIKEVRKLSKKRNFSQTFDLIINLKGLDIKKPEHNINTFVILPHGKGNRSKICAFVDDEMFSNATKAVDLAINQKEFEKYSSNKKSLKKIVKEYDYFIAQANLMPEIAKHFGKVLGPQGKMPNPKAGCIFPPGADLKPLNEKLQKSVQLQTKNESIVKCSVGKEDFKDEQIEANISTIYNVITHALPHGEGNVKSVLLKLTMGKAKRVGEDEGKESN